MEDLRPFLLLLSAFFLLHRPVSSLIGGKPAGKAVYINGQGQRFETTSEFPYMATLEYLSAYQGGAVIVSPTYVLTAAHCVKGKLALSLKVRAGTFTRESSKTSSDVQVRKVSSVIVHDNYEQKVKLPDYDLALLKLKKAFELTAYVNVVQLAVKSRSDQYADMQGVILGHGQTERAIVSKNLMRAGVGVLTNEECRNKSPVRLGNSMICSIGRPENAGPCIGDSGGPLIVRHNADNPTLDVLVGISALIIEKRNSRFGTPCDPNLPGIFADVGDHRKWINSHIKKKN